MERGAKSTIVTTANVQDDTSIAALLEVARLVKSSKSRSHNYLFIAYCGEEDGAQGTNYFTKHPTISSLPDAATSINLDTLSATVDNPKGLNLVKRSVDIIQQKLISSD